jgi:hypothetical protein
MLYLVLGALAVLVLVAAGRRGRPVRVRREWRFLSTAGAIAALAAAVLLGIREAWLPALLLGAFGLSLAFSARLDGNRPQPHPPSGSMSEAQARSILGVGPQASREEIQAAYRRLMERVHPDRGGASGLAAQLNAARDRLLRK